MHLSEPMYTLSEPMYILSERMYALSEPMYTLSEPIYTLPSRRHLHTQLRRQAYLLNTSLSSSGPVGPFCRESYLVEFHFRKIQNSNFLIITLSITLTLIVILSIVEDQQYSRFQYKWIFKLI